MINIIFFLRLDWLSQSHKDDNGMDRQWGDLNRWCPPWDTVIICDWLLLNSFGFISERDPVFFCKHWEASIEKITVLRFNEDWSVVSAFKQLTVWWGKWTKHKPFSRGGRPSTCWVKRSLVRTCIRIALGILLPWVPSEFLHMESEFEEFENSPRWFSSIYVPSHVVNTWSPRFLEGP